MSDIPKDGREADKLLLDAKIYAALNAIGEVGKCFGDKNWWDEKIAERTINDLQEAVDEVIERVTHRKRRRPGENKRR